MTVQVKEIPESNPALRAVILKRISTTQQEEGSGIERQELVTEAICKQKNYQIVKRITEVNVSGVDIMASPKFQLLLQMAENKEFDILVIAEISRLVRASQYGDLAILDILFRNNIKIDAGGTIHGCHSSGDFMLSGISALMAGGERIDMKNKMKASKEVRRREGKCPSGDITLPTGISYDRELERYYLNPDIAKVQEAFRLLVNENIRPFSELARRVGIKYPTLKNIFRNKVYIGVRRYEYKRSETLKYPSIDGKQSDRPKVKRAANEIIEVRIFEPDQQPITDSQFEQANKILDEAQASHFRVKGEFHPHAISGIGECALCLQPLIGVSAPSRRGKNGDRGHYICKSHHYTNKGRLPRCEQGWLRKQKLEDTLIAFTVQQLCDETLVREMVEASNKLKSQKITAFQPPAPEELMRNINLKLERLMSAYEAGCYSISELKTRRSKLDIERELIIAQIDGQENLKQGETEFKIDPPLIAKAGSLDKVDDPKELKQILHALYSSVLFDGMSVVGFRFTPNVLPQNGPTAFPDIMTEGYITLPQPFSIYDPNPKPVKPKKSRKCNKCAQTKPLDEFNRKSRKGGDCAGNRRRTCAECYRKQNRDRAKKRKEKGEK